MQSATKLPQIVTTATDPCTGITYVDENDLFTVGAGYRNVQAALADINLPTLPATSPTATYNSATQTVTMVTPAGAVWGSGAIWGSGAVWGRGAVWGQTSADQTTAVTIAINGDQF